MDVGVDFLNGTLGATYLSGSGHLVLTTGTIAGHIVLALSGLSLSFHRLIGGIYLVALLGGNDTLVEEALDALIRLLGNLHSCLSLLHHVVSTTNLLLAGTVLSLQFQGCSSILSTLGLLHLGAHLRGIQNGQRVAHLDEVALFHANLQNTAWHLAGHSILTHFHLTLNQFRITPQGKETNQGYDDNDCCKSKDCIQNIIMLCFC